ASTRTLQTHLAVRYRKTSSPANPTECCSMRRKDWYAVACHQRRPKMPNALSCSVSKEIYDWGGHRSRMQAAVTRTSTSSKNSTQQGPSSSASTKLFMVQGRMPLVCSTKVQRSARSIIDSRSEQLKSYRMAHSVHAAQLCLLRIPTRPILRVF